MFNLNHEEMIIYPKTNAKDGCIGKQVTIRERIENSIILTRHTIKGVQILPFAFGLLDDKEKLFTIKLTLDNGCALHVSPIWQTYERNGEKNIDISIFAATDDLRSDFIAIANFKQLEIQCSLPYTAQYLASCYVWDDETNSAKLRRHHIMPSPDYYEVGPDFKLKLRPFEVSYGEGEYATAEECEAANKPDKYKLIASAFLWHGELGLSDDDLISLVNDIL